MLLRNARVALIVAVCSIPSMAQELIVDTNFSTPANWAESGTTGIWAGLNDAAAGATLSSVPFAAPFNNAASGSIIGNLVTTAQLGRIYRFTLGVNGPAAVPPTDVDSITVFDGAASTVIAGSTGSGQFQGVFTAQAAFATLRINITQSRAAGAFAWNVLTASLEQVPELNAKGAVLPFMFVGLALFALCDRRRAQVA